MAFLSSLADEQLGYLVANNFDGENTLIAKAVNAANIRIIRMIQFLPIVIVEAEKQIEETAKLKNKFRASQEQGAI